jgi:hypothetical protein
MFLVHGRGGSADEGRSFKKLDRALDRPALLRQEAERYRRLAEDLTAEKECETAMEYCRELLDLADRLDAARKAPR